MQDVENYPWPETPRDFTTDELADLKRQVEQIKSDGWVVRGSGVGIFEAGWGLRGMDTMLMDLMTGNEVSAAILDWFTERSIRRARLSASIGCDLIVGGDDIGMQDRMLMSPDLWRKEIKPRAARYYNAAKEANPDIRISYHSDGFIEPVIDDLIEIGIDLLNPVQPESMDQERIKRTYGDRLCLERCIGTQTVLPFGSPEEIERQVRWTIDVLGAGGGLILGPTHTLEPDVPWENFVAFYRAVIEHGGYENYPGQMPVL